MTEPRCACGWTPFASCTCRTASGGASATGPGTVNYATALQAFQERVLGGIHAARVELSPREFDELLDEVRILAASLSLKGWRP